MNNMIDLVPYLPRQEAPAVQEASAVKEKKSRSRMQEISAGIESVLSLCIGTGFFLMLAAFFAVML